MGQRAAVPQKLAVQVAAAQSQMVRTVPPHCPVAGAAAALMVAKAAGCAKGYAQEAEAVAACAAHPCHLLG